MRSRGRPAPTRGARIETRNQALSLASLMGRPAPTRGARIETGFFNQAIAFGFVAPRQHAGRGLKHLAKLNPRHRKASRPAPTRGARIETQKVRALETGPESRPAQTRGARMELMLWPSESVTGCVAPRQHAGRG